MKEVVKEQPSSLSGGTLKEYLLRLIYMRHLHVEFVCKYRRAYRVCILSGAGTRSRGSSGWSLCTTTDSTGFWRMRWGSVSLSLSLSLSLSFSLSILIRTLTFTLTLTHARAGKTIQAIAVLCHVMEKRDNTGPFLIVVPNSTLPNWANEFEQWAPHMERVIYKVSSVQNLERQRQRDRHIQRDSATARQRDRATARQRDRETERQRDRRTETQTKLTGFPCTGFQGRTESHPRGAAGRPHLQRARDDVPPPYSIYGEFVYVEFVGECLRTH